MEGPRCPVCDDAETRHVFDVDSNVDGPLPRPHGVWRCLDCGAGLTHPPPPAESLPFLYGSTAHEQSGGEGRRAAEAYVMAIEDLRLRAIHRYHRPPGRLLDVGSGKGRFLRRAARHGWTVHGLDQAPGQVAAAKARFGLQVEHGDLTQSRLSPESFDVITSWHVVEHLPDPRAHLARVRALLRPQGLFACEVPNFASWQARLSGRDAMHLDVPRHLAHHTPSSLSRLLSGEGLHPLRYTTFSPLGPYGMLQSWLNMAGLPPNWLYGWLRGTLAPVPRSTLVANLAVAVVTALPALGLETLSAVVGRGSIIQLIAQKR
jgi:SAM-dependent methyltransferase